MFIDEILITVKAGDGGDGIIAFLREKRRPKGGPAGGDGGCGGDVVMRATRNVDTLFHLSHFHELIAKDGERGGNKNMSGKDGVDLVLEVPVGTVIKRGDTGDVVADLDRAGAVCIAAAGGRGGRGNQHFATSFNRAPRESEDGEPGESIDLRLELKLIAHVGLVGLPNAGKSSLLARVSDAHPKIADYPFTTKEPQLGIMDAGGFRQVVIADIPGLIEGAHAGKGMGDAFLRHIERTLIVVHMVDCCPVDGTNPGKSFRQIEKELALYSAVLAAKPRIVAANKMDLPGAEDGLKRLKRAAGKVPVLPISALTGLGVPKLMGAVIQRLSEMPEWKGRLR
jgi:GTPase